MVVSPLELDGPGFTILLWNFLPALPWRGNKPLLASGSPSIRWESQENLLHKLPRIVVRLKWDMACLLARAWLIVGAQQIAE